MLRIVTKNHVWGVEVQNASSHRSIYSFKSSVRYFPEICILSFVLIAELTRLALPGQNDQFPWPVKTALSRNVAMGSKSYSQSRLKSSGSSERMITTDWQSLDPQVPGKEDIAHLTSHTGHSLAEPGFHILCCCHSFMHPLQLLTQCPQARLALNQDGPTFWRFECNTHCQLNALFLTRILCFFAYLRQWR